MINQELCLQKSRLNELFSFLQVEQRCQKKNDSTRNENNAVPEGYQ